MITGGTYGIEARNYGTGVLEIVANGDVAGTTNTGIFARSYGVDNGTSLSITSQGVTGGDNGIFAQSFGSGAVTVMANGDVEGTDVFGLYARSQGVRADGLSLDITSEGVTGGLTGIRALNFGTGALEIVANGDVKGTSVGSTGIYALNANAAGTGPLTITSEGVTGGLIGISATNSGTGALEITTHGEMWRGSAISASMRGTMSAPMSTARASASSPMAMSSAAIAASMPAIPAPARLRSSPIATWRGRAIPASMRGTITAPISTSPPRARSPAASPAFLSATLAQGR